MDVAIGRKVGNAVYRYADGVIDEHLPGTSIKLEPDTALQNTNDYIETLKGWIEMSQLLLGIDVGTYSSKGVLVEPTGKVLKSCVIDHQMEIPKPGWAEQDADEVWWGDVVNICNMILDGSPYSGDDIASVAVSAIGPCMLPLDDQGHPLRKGILYGVDTRASAEIAYLNQKLGEDTNFQFSGMALSSQAVGPKILWKIMNRRFGDMSIMLQPRVAT